MALLRQTADGSGGGRRPAGADVVVPKPVAPVAPGPVPTFAVLVAAYQASATIGDALASAFAQTVPPQEVIVCDDGSTDDLDRSIAPYRDRIVLLRQVNAGEAAAKNACARAASADFLVFLDADDLFMPERLEALGALAMARPDLDLLTTDAYLEVDGVVVRRCYAEGFAFEVDDQRLAILDRNFIFGLVGVSRERFLAAGGFDTALRYATDWDLWCRLILGGVRAGLVNRPLATYRLRPESLSGQRSQLLDGRCAVLEKARSRSDLEPAERRTLESALERERRARQLARLSEALSAGRSDARQLAFELARTRSVPTVTRARAVFAAIAPRAARRAIRRRVQREGLPGQAGVVFRSQ